MAHSDLIISSLSFKFSGCQYPNVNESDDNHLNDIILNGL